MESTSSACWRDCIDNIWNSFDLDAVKQQFERADCLSGSDGDQSIARAERAISVDSMEPMLRFLCVLHRLGTNREMSFEAVKKSIDMVKWFVLSIRKGGLMKVFRKAVLRVFVRKAQGGVIRDRLPSSSQRLANQKLIENFVDKRKSRSRNAGAAVCALLPGDWQDTTCVELFPNPGETDAQCIRRGARVYRKWALGTCPESFPGNKWQKVRSSLDFMGLLLPHGLLEDGYFEFILAARAQQKPPEAHNAAAGEPVPVLPLEDVAEGAEGADGARIGLDLGAEDAPGPRGPAPEPQPAVKDPMEALREEQEHYRKLTSENFKALGHDGLVMSLLMVIKPMAPHVELMERNFWRAGARYDLKQQTEEIRRQLREPPPEGFAPLRRFRIEEAYEGKYEKAMLSQTFSLMHQNWTDVPSSQRTQNNQTDAFKVLARGAVRTHREQREHENYPFKLLASPWHQHLAAEIHAESYCPRRRTPWDDEFLQEYPNVNDPAAQVEIIAVNASYNGHEETLAVEAYNGFVRKFLGKRSQGCKAVDLSGLNMYAAREHVRGDERATQREAMQHKKLENLVRKEKQKAEASHAKQRQRSLSDWELFYIKKTKGIKRAQWPTWEDMKTQYKKLKMDPEELAAFRGEELALRAEAAGAQENQPQEKDLALALLEGPADGLDALPKSAAFVPVPKAMELARQIQRRGRLNNARTFFWGGSARIGLYLCAGPPGTHLPPFG